jgi:hypothetical protein
MLRIEIKWSVKVGFFCTAMYSYVDYVNLGHITCNVGKELNFLASSVNLRVKRNELELVF